MLKALIVILSLVLATAAGMYYFFWLPADSSELPIPAQLKTIRRSAHGAGVIEGNSTITHLKFPFAGIVNNIEAKENGTVQLGDTVATMDSTEMDDRIAQEEIALKEAKAKRDAIVARKKSDLVEKKEAELKHAKAETLDAELKVLRLKAPAAAADWQMRQEDAKIAVERAQRALTLAEAEQKLLLTHPTPHELEAAEARLAAAKLRIGQNAEATAAELRFALADYDKIKHGVSAEEKEVAAARIAQARTELDRAESEKRRLDKPQPAVPVPAAEIELAQKALAEAQSREDKKHEELDLLRHDAEEAEKKTSDAAVERCEQNLKSMKRMKLGYELHAPFKGLVVKRLVEPDTLLMPYEDVLWIVAFTHKRVRAEFDIEKLQALLKPDLSATIKSRAFGKEELTARVVEMSKIGPRKLLQDDPSQPKGGEVVEVIMEIDKPTDPAKLPIFELLRPGLRVEADIILESRANVLAVPKSYVSSENGENGVDKMYVMKVDANAKKQKSDSAHKQDVTCGMRDEYYVEIVEGLSVDDLIVKPKAQGK